VRYIEGIRVWGGSFLELVLKENNWDLKKAKKNLEKEYYETSTTRMAKRWGFHYQTVYNTIKKLGIKIKPKGWAGTKTRFQLKVEEFGGYEKMMEKFKYERLVDIARKLGFSGCYTKNCLLKAGYDWDKNKGEWIKL